MGGPAPRQSSCAPWINGGDLANVVIIQKTIYEIKKESSKPNPTYTLSDTQVDAILATSAVDATEILYRLTARQFAGNCGPETIRPVARPVNADSRGWIRRNWSYGGYGSTSSMFLGSPPVVSSYGPEYPPEIILYDYPIREILLVKIDGEVIPPIEYELRDFQRLVRIRPTYDYVPTARWGWPTSQIPDLPDDQIGTFSVTYTWGADPGQSGRDAAIALATYIALGKLGTDAGWPARISSFSRQGVSGQVVSPIDMINKGATGIPEVDLWILAVNPTKARRQGVVWSPDRAPNRRQANVTNS